MDKKRKELLDKIEQKVIPFIKNYLEEHNFKDYEVKDVFYYRKEIELVNKETKKRENFKLYAVQAEKLNPEAGKDSRFELECLEDENGNLFTIEELRLRYEEESFKDIGKVVQETEYNEKLPEEEQDKKFKKDSLEELKREREQEDKEAESKKKNSPKEELVTNKKISNIKGEVDLDQQVNGETLRKILDLGEEYDSIAPVRAASIGVPSNSEYVFVAIKTDKTCMVLGEDIIKEDRQKGTNPEEKDLMINNDGSLTEESSLYNFRIVNRPNLVMTGRRDKNSSTIATTISDVSGRESRDEEVAQELHKDGDRRIDDDARNLLREENGIEASDNLSKKQEGHEAAGCENDRVENIDEDTSNDIPHINPDDLIPDTEITWRKFAEMCGYRGKDGVEKAHKEFIKHKSDNPDLSNEELIDTKVEELKQEMPSSRKR